MSVIIDGILHNPDDVQQKDAADGAEKWEDFDGKPFGRFIIDFVEESLRTNGDWNFTVNADLVLQGLDHDSLAAATIKVSELIPTIKCAGRAFHQVLGLRKDDTVQIYLPNTTAYFFPVFGTALCQGVVSVADPGLKVEIMAHQLRDTVAKVMVCTMDNLENCIQARKEVGREKDLPIVVMSYGEVKDNWEDKIYSFNKLIKEAEDNLKEEDGPDMEFKDWSSSDRSSIVWSSGTTGIPKGIQHNHKMLAHALRPQKKSPFDGDWIQTTCMFHGSGFISPFGRLRKRDTTYIFPVEALEGNTEKILQAVDRFKVSSLLAGSHHVMRMAAMADKFDKSLDLTALKMVLPIGSNVSSDAYEKLVKIFPKLVAVPNAYGMTEFGNIVTIGFTPKNLGVAAPGTQVKIVDPETEEILGPNQVGEIYARCDEYMMGYLNRPEDNKKFFAPDRFIRTGDLGHYDDNRILHFDGRNKELIKFENKHVFPVEMEDLIVKHPSVAEVGVFGKPDPLVQELITAVVVLKPGCTADEDEITNFVAGQVEDFKRLRGGVIFTDKLPRNKTGKVVRRELAKLVA